MMNSWDNFWQKQSTTKPQAISWSKQRMLDLLSPYLVRGKRGLDAGCGSGFFAKIFCDSGMVVTALDYSEQALALATQATQGKARVVKADFLVDKLDNLFPEKFDLIFSDGLFEHFSAIDQDRIMQNFISALAPQGILATFVPNLWSPWQILRPFLMPGIHEKPFTLSRLQAFNERHGLGIIKKGGINTLPFKYSPEGTPAAVCGMLVYTFSTRNC